MSTYKDSETIEQGTDEETLILLSRRQFTFVHFCTFDSYMTSAHARTVKPWGALCCQQC